ncbi:MAG: primosome assembly protein PriA, partial [Acidothermus sp.]|nr:primosome assembly protein PriA [Acidothermus sp.]
MTVAARRDPQVAAELPVARCVVDVPLPHLDRLFDYLVPASLDSQVVVGGRIRVRFSGKLHDAFVVERTAESDHPGRLAFVERVIDSEPVLTPEILELARIVARRWAGTLADVLRLAVPPRAARPGSAPPNPVPLPLAAAADVPGPSSWERYSSGPALLEAVREGRGPRAIWTALPGQHDGTPLWAWETAEAVRAAAEGARGALVVVPETADLCWLEAACQARLGPGTFVALSAELAPAERYRRFLAALRGEVRVVVGTRAAVFAPIRDLGLIIVWDDGNDLLAERRAPYPHAR